MSDAVSVEPDAFLAACPSREVLARIGEKWSALTLVALSSGAMRFGQLRRRVDGISQKMLSQTLRHLESDGLVTRWVFDERPLRVEYRLTASSEDLVPLLRDLKRWAESHLQQIQQSRAKPLVDVGVGETG